MTADQLANLVRTAVAEGVREALADHQPAHANGGEWLDAKATAERFGVSRDYIYEHADRLGARRLGDGSKARLRFNPDRVAAALDGDSAHADIEPPAPSARRRVRERAGVPLLPVKGQVVK